MATLSPRMKGWIERFGCHIGTATKSGFPTTIVVEQATVEGDSVVSFDLTDAQVNHIKDNMQGNPYVALAPHAIASIRAAYQFKGAATLSGNTLKVDVKEIYCTKPGPEAALRLDTLPQEHVIKFEESRWRDVGPPK
ncbi:hypothetical protein MNBD_NITROSPINAE04-2585 [hydrothermal vent metagenome]|uniref:Pyridoxamine 5'-phosphate oxidase putative domain-containing protein n=1 Tax=hydrothermal vent metagenome TaxID=652676 RepID=A0A3B1CMF8_9ZZZZ